MASDTATTPADCEVMAAVDGDEGERRLVIAAVCADDAWISMSLAEAESLAARQ